jgi:hypothetical protein
MGLLFGAVEAEATDYTIDALGLRKTGTMGSTCIMPGW